MPLLGAVQAYQTDLPPGLLAWLGSPASFVARVLLPKTCPELPLIV